MTVHLQGAGGQHISDVVASSSPRKNAVVLAVGPEGGWVDYEVQMFKDHGFIQVRVVSPPYSLEIIGKMVGQPPPLDRGSPLRVPFFSTPDKYT